MVLYMPDAVFKTYRSACMDNSNLHTIYNKVMKGLKSEPRVFQGLIVP